MNIIEALGRYLIANSSIKAITSEIRPQVLPDDAVYPAITYAQEQEDRIELLAGSFSGLAQASAVINIYADTYAAARNLADVVRSQLDGYVGLMSSVSARRTVCDVDFDRYENGQKQHSVSQTYTIWYLIE